MADRLSQLQDAINQQAENFTNSLGILQQSAVPSIFPNLGNRTAQPPQDDFTTLFAQLVTRTAKDIELLIDSLPSEDSSSDLQYNSLLTLEEENRDTGKSLEAVIHEGEATLKEIHAALHDIAKAQLEMQKLEAEVSHH